MTLSILYGDRQGLFTAVDLAGSVRAGTVTLTSSAQSGQISESTIAFEDPNGNLGHAGDQILGLKTLTSHESDCPVNNRLLHWGYIHDREYVEVPAQALLTGEAVLITASVAGLNDESRYYVITGSDGNRPAETVSARLTWLLASTYISLYDNGLVVYPTTTMPANDYRNQTGADVLDDCAETVGYNWFIYIAEAVSNQPSLFFDDPNTSTAYPAILRISTVFADMDSSLTLGDGATHTWMPSAPAVLKRSPNNVASKQILAWAKGTTSGSRAATAVTYGIIDATTADSRITTSAAATARVNRLLLQSSTEEDVITCSLQLLRANVNDVREGQWLAAKFRNLPGYKTAFSNFRVLERTVKQEEITDLFYTVDLVLSPQEILGPSYVQTATERHQDDITFPVNTTVGHLLLYFSTWRQLLTSPQPPTQETWTFIGQGNLYSDTHDAPTNNAVVVYATIVTTARATYTKQAATGGSSNGSIAHSVMYEISNAAIGDLTAICTPGATSGPASTLNIGAISGPLMFGAWANGYDGFFIDPSGIQITTPGDWTRSFYASRDFDTTSSNTLFGAGFPFTWYGRSTTATSATTTISDTGSPHDWGGVAVSVG